MKEHVCERGHGSIYPESKDMSLYTKGISGTTLVVLHPRKVKNDTLLGDRGSKLTPSQASIPRATSTWRNKPSSTLRKKMLHISFEAELIHH